MELENRPLIDPDCSICGAPGFNLCRCEGLELEAAVNRAQELMMANCLEQIREWVKFRARNFILDYFKRLSNQHEREYNEHILEIESRSTHYYNSAQYLNEVDLEGARLKHNINEAWKASIQRYPEVLQYFYTLVDISRPDDSDACVINPPIYLNDEARPRIPMNARTRDGENISDLRGENDREYDHKLRRRRRRSEKHQIQEREENILRSERARDTYDDYRQSNHSRSKKYGHDRGKHGRPHSDAYEDQSYYSGY
ncbi:hypothetical protein HI914_07033 [Erysiphe necator]|uniref:Uncharacterized protein n=1 Tax=Uncinula necator TaxID=52586 RepID=A0A0B1P8A4_UNCNE|nr:hypothetical protein HI914_07033 [Erysiphe necator]KHJ34488.1 hypothetical protein EV44_g5338 [Erysiphe necator]